MSNLQTAPAISIPPPKKSSGIRFFHKPKTNLGELIQESRKAWSLTQKQLARDSGLSLLTIVRWESGESSPRKAHWETYAEQLALGLRVAMRIVLEALRKDAPDEPEEPKWKPRYAFGRFVRARRKKFHLTIPMLAQRMMRSDSAVRTAERQGRRIRRSSLMVWAKALQCHPKKLERFAKAPREKAIKDPLGRYIRKTRLERGKTQGELAEEIGVTHQRVAEIEMGYHSSLWDAEKLKTMAMALGVDVVELEKRRRAKKKPQTASKMRRDLLKSLEVLSGYIRRLVQLRNEGYQLRAVKGRKKIALDFIV